MKEYDRHHRLPRSRGGKNDKRNISFVPRVKHIAWHTLFENLSAQEIANIINDCWLDPKYQFICKERENAKSSAIPASFITEKEKTTDK